MSNKLLSTVAILLSIPLAGCNPTGGGGSDPGPSGLQSVGLNGTPGDWDPNAPTIVDPHDNTGCYDTASNTPLILWDEQFASSPTVTTPIWWFTNNNSSSAVLYVYTGGSVAGSYWQIPMSESITAWYQSLQNNVATGHYMSLNPAETSDYSQALIQTRVVNDFYNRDIGGRVVFGTRTSPGLVSDGLADWHQYVTFHGTQVYLAGALITLNDAANGPVSSDGNFTYAIAAHEMGHALGDAHNRKEQSLMYPQGTERYNAGCDHEGALPIRADVQLLENHYDPILHDPNYGDGTTCRGSRCYLAKRRSAGLTPGASSGSAPHDVFSAVGARTATGDAVSLAARPTGRQMWPSNASVAEIRRIANAQRKADYAASRGAPNVRNQMRHLQWWHAYFDGGIDPNRLSLDSMVLGTSLVARGHVTRVLSKTPIGPIPSTVYQEFKIDDVVSAARSAGESAHKGDTIVIGEETAYEDVPFADDPLLVPAQNVVVFLNRVPGNSGRTVSGRQIYNFTSSMVAKWGVTPSGRLEVLGSNSTRVARSVNHAAAQSMLATLGGRRVQAVGGAEGDAFRAMAAARRGLQFDAYQRRMQADPAGELSRQYKAQATRR